MNKRTEIAKAATSPSSPKFLDQPIHFAPESNDDFKDKLVFGGGKQSDMKNMNELFAKLSSLQV